MQIAQFLLIPGGLGLIALLGWLAYAGPNPAKESKRRLSALRFRLAAGADDRLEERMRKAVAARKPKAHMIAGSQSRGAALALRLHRTGTGWTMQKYIQGSVGLGLAVAVLLFVKLHFLLLSIMLGAVVGAGLPHMVVGYLINKRGSKFTNKFPDAIELLVRGLRSGLPVTETLVVVGHEVPGPVGEEFKLITERIKIGRTMEQALQETADRLNMAEFSFFCITLAIQRETGGNLAETLANLADVLRKRAQMKLKIRAMSSESKASAYIVGSLPFMVFIMVNWEQPDYLQGFWAGGELSAIGIGGLTWMAIGVFIMKQMISFEI